MDATTTTELTVASVTISGRLSSDPEIRYSRQGIAETTICLVTLATQEQAGARITVRCFGDMAENVALSLMKGIQVVAVGAFVAETTETEDGESRTQLCVMASDVAASMCSATVEVSRTERRDAY